MDPSCDDNLVFSLIRGNFSIIGYVADFVIKPYDSYDPYKTHLSVNLSPKMNPLTMNSLKALPTRLLNLLNGLPDLPLKTNMKIRLQINMVNEWILVMVEITLDRNLQSVKVWEILDIPEVVVLQDQTSNTRGENEYESYRRVGFVFRVVLP